jgi:hypothetical protein
MEKTEPLGSRERAVQEAMVEFKLTREAAELFVDRITEVWERYIIEGKL